VTPLLLAGAGVLAFLGGIVVVRSFGPAGRIGRIIAGTRRVSIAEAVELAAMDTPAYVRVDGRIDADEEFEDDAHRPLVLRLSRLEMKTGASWETLEAGREAVPFAVRAGPETIAIDVDDLDEGLVVIPRQAVGRAADIPGRLPPSAPPEAEVRFVVRQVSSVEHAAAFGAPRIGADGQARLAAGRGRPLILTTLETDEAIRLLAGGRRSRSALAVGLVATGAIAVTAAAVWGVVEAVAG
jgi:hypothetical protein